MKATLQSTGGKAVKLKEAPQVCPYCGKDLRKKDGKEASWHRWLGHLGFWTFCERYFRGDSSKAGRYIWGFWAAENDPAPWNGAWAKKELPEADYSYGNHQCRRLNDS